MFYACLNLVTWFQLLGIAYGLAILQRDAVASAQQQLGVEALQFQLHLRYQMLLGSHASLDGYGQAVADGLYPMALFAYYAQGEGAKLRIEDRQLVMLPGKPLADSIGDALAGIVEAFQYAQQIVDEQGCSSRRRFDMWLHRHE